MYGVSATSLNEADIKSFSFVYNSIFCKIFKTTDKDTIACCQYYCGYLSFTKLYDMHRFLFLSKLVMNSNVSNVLKIDELDFNDYLSLIKKYNFEHEDSKYIIKQKVWKVFETEIF